MLVDDQSVGVPKRSMAPVSRYGSEYVFVTMLQLAQAVCFAVNGLE